MQPCSRNAQQVLRHEVEQVIHFLRKVCLAVRSIYQRQQSALLARAHLVKHTEFQHRAGKARQNAHRTLVVGALSSQCLPEFAHLAPYGIKLALKVLLVHGMLLQGACPQRITRGSHAALQQLARGVRSSILLRALTQQHIHTGLVGSTLGGIRTFSLRSIGRGIAVLAHTQRAAHGVVLLGSALGICLVGNLLHTAVTTCVRHVLVTAPQHVAKFVVGKRHRVVATNAKAVKHLQEEQFYLLPERRTDVLKVHVLCQTCQVFLRGAAEVPPVLGGQRGNAAPYRLVGSGIHIVKEHIEALAKQASQTFVRHGLVQHRAQHIARARVVGNDNGDFPRLGVKPTLRLAQLRFGYLVHVRHHLHSVLVKPEFLSHAVCHAFHADTFTLSKGSPLLLRAFNAHLTQRIILITQHSVGNDAVTLAQENFCIFRIFSIRNRWILGFFSTFAAELVVTLYACALNCVFCERVLSPFLLL